MRHFLCRCATTADSALLPLRPPHDCNHHRSHDLKMWRPAPVLSVPDAGPGGGEAVRWETPEPEVTLQGVQLT